MKIVYLLIISVFIGCKKENVSDRKIDYKSNSKIESVFSFPDTVKVGEMNLAILTFYNSTFDTIVELRKRDSLKFRYMFFSEFQPINILSNDTVKVYKKSILLDDRDIYIGYEFDKIGIYEIGGLVSDELIYDYRFIRNDSIQYYKSQSLVSKYVVVIK